MKELLYVIAAILLTVICWGAYGPVLHKGQAAMPIEGTAQLSRLRPLICVGMAYFVIAVVVPLILIHVMGQEYNVKWTFWGIFWSSAGGAAGAVGALGIILAFTFGGKPTYVMPLVFGCAPVVNAFLTIYWAGTWKNINPIFYAGLTLVAVGAAMVLIFTPQKPKGHAAASPPAKVAAKDVALKR